MKELFKATSLLSLQRVVVILLGMIHVKVSAIYLAPAGLGIVAQVTDLRVFILRFVDLGVGAGITKYVAAYNAAKDRRVWKVCCKQHSPDSLSQEALLSLFAFSLRLGLQNLCWGTAHHGISSH